MTNGTEVSGSHGSTLDPVPDLISLSQAGSRFDFELPPKASEMQPSLSSHALKQLLKLAKVLERLFFITLPALAPARVRQYRSFYKERE